MMKETVKSCPKCGSGFLAWGKPILPKGVVLTERGKGICCMVCRYYSTVKAWNEEER